MIIGARQIGKTYIIKEFCKNEFENYIYINLLDNPQIVDLFEQSIPTEEKFTKMQWILNKNIDVLINEYFSIRRTMSFKDFIISEIFSNELANADNKDEILKYINEVHSNNENKQL